MGAAAFLPASGAAVSAGLDAGGAGLGDASPAGICDGWAAAGADFAAGGGAATDGGELAGAAFSEPSAFEERSGCGGAAGETLGFSSPLSGNCGSGDFLATSSGATMSTKIGSALNETKGLTSVKKITSIRHDKWTSADAVMPDRRICRGSTVFDQRRCRPLPGGSISQSHFGEKPKSVSRPPAFPPGRFLPSPRWIVRSRR